MSAIELPPGSVLLHRSIAKKAVENLGRMVDGNGMKADQIRLSREETRIYSIPAYIAVKLTTEVLKKRVQGKAIQGMEVATQAEAMDTAEGLIKTMLKDFDVQRQISEGLKKDPGRGFGMDQLIILLPAQRKDFSAITPCPKCSGEAFVSCARCNGSGNIPCTTCMGTGSSPCQKCQGMGRVQDQTGTFVPCLPCQNTGRILCQSCRGQRFLVCTTCRGQKRVGCAECKQTGSFTEIYQVDYKAECTFEADWRDVPNDAKVAAHKLGLRALAIENHAEILWQPLEARSLENRPDAIYVPCIAFLPVAKAEFSAPDGHIYPALVAGLRGRILEIEPVLDPYVKPGISALMKLAKGPLARQALIDTACKYRLIRQTLAGLARSSQKTVYQQLCKNYPLMLSDKYARATVKYAASAVAALSAGPRYKGLAAGTLLATLPAALYYLTPLRHILLTQMMQRYMEPYILAPDIAVWLACWGIAVYTIRLVTSISLKKMLPDSVPLDKGGLPAAGLQGLAALLTTGLVWFAIAARAAEKPVWVMHILKLFGL